VEATLDVLVRRVQQNMLARAQGVTLDHARQTIQDVLDALSSESWGARDQAEVCESEFEGLVNEG